MPVRPRRFYVDGPFGQIHARKREPDAPSDTRPLYCLHQSPKSGLEFEAFMACAGADRTVVASDYPGYGLSDPPPSEEAATIEAYADSVWAVADALGHQAIDLFGNHTGGKVAAAMALQRPDAVGGIVMVSAAILTDEERAQFTDYFTPIPLDEAGTRFQDMWTRITRHAGPGMTLEMRARSLLQNMMGGEGYEWGHAAAFAWGKPFDEALGRLAHRITILNPGDELQTATRRASALMRNGVVVEKPDWGHGFLEVHAQDTADLVRAALAES